MAAIIIDNDLITVADAAITVQSTATGFAKANVMNHAYLKRRWRMDSLSTSNTNPVMYFDLTSAQTVAAIILDDINFSQVVIKGHATNLTTDWTSASFTSGTITISKDSQTNRYKAYIPLTAFNYRWLAIIIPTTATAVGSYTDKWEIGRVGILDTATEFSKNMAFGYQRGVSTPCSELELGNGHKEKLIIGVKRWESTCEFGIRTTTQEADLTTLNNMDKDSTLIFYENDSDTSKVYFCQRDSDYYGTLIFNDLVESGSIRFTEQV
jgi:hypothetical protein